MRYRLAVLLPGIIFLVGCGSESAVKPSTTPTAAASVVVPIGNWSNAASMATARWEHAAILLATGKVLLMGGDDPNTIGIRTAELYDPTTDTLVVGEWTPYGPVERYGNASPGWSGSFRWWPYA